MNILLQLWLKHAHASKCLDSPILNANQVLLGNNTRHVLLMGKLSLCLSCLLLVSTALFLSIDARFSSFESLSLDKLRVAYLLIFFLLGLHAGEFALFKDFHARLLESLQAEDIEHGLDLLVEVEKLVISIKDLCRLAVLLRWHLWLEERHRGSVEVKFGCDTHLLSGRLIRQVFYVLVGLYEEMVSAHDRLW